MAGLNLRVRAFSSPAQPFFSSPSVLLRSGALLSCSDLLLSGGHLLLLLVPSVHPTQVTLLAFEETFYLIFFHVFLCNVV